MAKLTHYNIGIALVVALGGFSFGFGSSSFITSIGQPGFYLYFALDPTSLHTANLLVALNCLFCAGGCVGSLGQSGVADKLGRKKALAIAAVIALVGDALVAGSVAMSMMITARFVQGCGLGALLALVPIYLSEVAPPRSRGLLAGLTTFSFGGGFVVCAWIAVGCFHSTNLTLSWRLPLALACLPPILLLSGLFFVPESPRFLVWRDRLDEAWAILKRLHHDPKSSTDEDARMEFNAIVAQLEAERRENASFIEMFRRPSWRRRCILVIFLLLAMQSTGVNGITNYLPVIFASLGLSSGMSLILYAVHTTCGTIFVAVSLLLVDRFGRRTLFLIGFATMALIGLAEGLLQWKYVGTTNYAGNSACVLFIFLFIAFFQCVDAPALIWSAEVFPTILRAKGVSLAVSAFFAGTLAFAVPAGVAFKSIGWHMYLIYCALSTVSLVVVYFYIPETKQIPIEEIGKLFGDRVATDNGVVLADIKEEGQHLEYSRPALAQES